LVQLRGTNPDQKSPALVLLPATAIGSKHWRAAERRVAAWISAYRGGRVAAFQRQAWRAWGAGESGLIHAPTGSGKTLAALGGPMIEAIARRAQADVGLSILWVTPLRALAADLTVQLEAPLHDLGNHDKPATLDQLRVEGFDQWEIGNILLRHKPDPHPSRYLIAGHVHPGATLRDGRLNHRFPAFWIGPKRCLLPAFGPLTGLAPYSPEQDDRVAILTPGGVVMKRPWFE
jgi:DEAD/DEAH box helicase